MENRRQGQLRVDADLDARADVGSGVPDTGGAEVLSSVARNIAGIGQRIGQWADHAATVEGAEAGRADGLDPEFRTTRMLTLRGEAYDKAGLQVHETAYRTRMLDDLQQTFDQAGSDPQALAGELRKKRAAWVNRALPEIRPDITLEFDKAELTLNRQSARAAAERAAAENRAALSDELALRMKHMQQRAYALGLDETADSVLTSDHAALEKALARTGVDGKPLIAPGDRSNILAKARAEMTDARIMGAFSRLPGIEAKAAFLQQFEEDYAASRGLAAEYAFDDFERLAGKLGAELRAARTQSDAASRIVAEQVRSVEKMAEKGFSPPPDEMAALKGQVQALAQQGNPALAQDFAEAEALLEWHGAVRRLPPQELDAWTRAERTRLSGNATPFAVRRLELGERLLDTMRTELRQDPLGWAARAGVIEVAPLDLGNPAQSLQTRIGQAEAVAAAYGQEPVYFRPDEKRSLAALAAQGGEQTLAVTSALSAPGDPDRAFAMARELFDETPAVAMLTGLSIAGGPTPGVRDAADGLALQKAEGFKPMAPSAADARLAAVTEIGTVFQDMPKSESAAIALANAVYEVRARRQGLTDFDETLWKQGLREVLGEREVGGERYGGVVRQGFWSGRSIILPPFVKQESWREVLDMLNEGDLALADLGNPVGGNGSRVPLSRIRNGGTLVQVGDGRYEIDMGDGAFVQRNAPGERFVLDLNALHPILKQRRPDLFLGGS